MAQQIQRPRVNQRKEQKEVRAVEATQSDKKSGEALKAEIDDLLDEIEDVLETNAEEFVKTYVQKGGE